MKKTIQELVAECGLVPSDIVKLSDGRLTIGQASVWLRDFKLSTPAELLLEWYCQRKVSEGVGPLPAGRKKAVFAEIFQPIALPDNHVFHSTDSVLNLVGKKKIPEKKVTGQYGKQKVEFVPATVEMTTEFTDAELEVIVPINGGKSYTLNATGLPSWGLDKTYKIVGGMLKLNYNGLAYKLLNVEKLDKKGFFVIGDERCAVSDCLEV